MKAVVNTVRSLRKVFASRAFLLTGAILMQIAVIIYFTNYITMYSNVINFIIRVMAFLIVVFILNKHNNPTFNIMWVIIICIFPIVGVLLYMLIGNRKVNPMLQNIELKRLINERQILKQDPQLEELFENNKTKSQFNYLKSVYFPYYKNTRSKYFALGDDFFPEFIKDLKMAEHFIFLEFFIISDGRMFQETYQVLKEKASKGVKVYLTYDDAGCVSFLGKQFNKQAKEDGIEAITFNPLRPKIAVTMNNRNHRKIVVIDNKVGYTGGCNLADEYINEKILFGHWKDSMLRIEGDAVWNITVMYIQFYNAISKTGKLDFDDFRLGNDIENDALYLPFSDSPSDEEDAGRSVHLNMINKAEKYIYIYTPYLVTDYDFDVALTNAAKQGVDVRIITPHIPDKSYVFAITRSNYRFLVNGGVKIYEYSPGFVHSKDFVCDDEIALVGTINMDYRSYYMHFEDGILLNDKETIKDIKEEYLKTISISHQITVDDLEKESAFEKIYRAILNLIALIM